MSAQKKQEIFFHRFIVNFLIKNPRSKPMPPLKKVNSHCPLFQKWLALWCPEQIDLLGLEELMEEGILNLYDEIPLLFSLEKNQDFQILEQKVHSFKGMLASLRMGELAEVFNALNEALKEKNRPQKQNPSLRNMLEKARILLESCMETVSGSPLKILIAEDHELSRKIIKALLKGSGIFYRIVSNGKEALAALKNLDYDLVILDARMPVMDGLSALKKIRENPASENLFVAALSAEHEKECGAEYLQKGFDAYLEKPFSLEKLDFLRKAMKEKQKRQTP